MTTTTTNSNTSNKLDSAVHKLVEGAIPITAGLHFVPSITATISERERRDTEAREAAVIDTIKNEAQL